MILFLMTLKDLFKKEHETKNYTKVWDVVREYLGRKYPELDGYICWSMSKHYLDDNESKTTNRGTSKTRS